MKTQYCFIALFQLFMFYLSMKILGSKLLYKHSKKIYTTVKAFAWVAVVKLVQRHFIVVFFSFSAVRINGIFRVG